MRIVLLDKSHNRADFECGEASLDEFLKRFALQNQRNNNSRTYVCTNDVNAILGYYSLSVGSVSHEDATAQIAKSQPRYPIPVIVMGRLAVDERAKGQGLGGILLRDALLRSLSIAQQAGVVAVIVDVLNENAKAFYEHFGFECSTTNPMRMMVSIKAVRQFLA